MLGADASLFGAPAVPAPWGVASPQYATELVDLYWCSLLRDVSFTDYATNAHAHAAADELSGLPFYAGPRIAGKVTPDLLFRGNFAGETVGPYLSQLLLTPTAFGAAAFDQRYITYRPGIDYMTDEASWFAVQQGISTGYVNEKDSVPRFLMTGEVLQPGPTWTNFTRPTSRPIWFCKRWARHPTQDLLTSPPPGKSPLGLSVPRTLQLS